MHDFREDRVSLVMAIVLVHVVFTNSWYLLSLLVRRPVFRVRDTEKHKPAARLKRLARILLKFRLIWQADIR